MMEKGIKCERCGSRNTMVMVVLFATMPSSFNRHLTKEKMRKKEFRLTGQDHDQTTVYCKECGYTSKF